MIHTDPTREVARTPRPFLLQGALVCLALAVVLIHLQRASEATQGLAAGLCVSELLKCSGRDRHVLN